MSKALIAMSGGIDSAVAALLTKNKGFECIGATLRLVCSSVFGLPAENDEKVENDIADAKKVAKRLDMVHKAYDAVDEFKKCVADYFVTAYEKGLTPNPCVVCNKLIKFGLLLDIAKENECDYIVTGHYARIEEKDGRFLLKKAVDETKDQSYFLYTLSQYQLAHSLFPLGEMTKEEARLLAEENGFVNARKRDSQDICFVPDGEYVNIIEHLTGKSYPEGEFISLDGKCLGTHKGIIRYTVGQRKGLGISLSKPAYVVEKNVTDNTVVLGDNEDLFTDTLRTESFNWIMFDTPQSKIRAKVKIRYNHKAQWATVTALNNGGVEIKFDEPQRAIAKGQSAVAYDGEYVIGGGIII